MTSSSSSTPNLRLLAAASIGDLPTIESLIKSQEAQPWYESEDLGWSALHYAAENGHTAVVRYLLKNGAIWNAVDQNGITAGEVAWSGNWDSTYNAILQHGVAQTLLLSALEQDDDEEEEEEEKGIETAEAEATVKHSEDDQQMTLTAAGGELTNSNKDFLASPLRFFTSSTADAKGKRRERCMDEDNNMVMSGWETEIMRRSATALCENHPNRENLRVLNVGYGLGIVDDFFQEYKPARHVIIEPHPDVIKYFQSKEISKAEGVELVSKRWEDALADPELGEFDVVYADPFAQDYKDLKKLFDLLPNILAGPEARFSFFHGLAGTNRFL